jgi:hypothetical protein
MTRNPDLKVLLVVSVTQKSPSLFTDEAVVLNLGFIPNSF